MTNAIIREGMILLSSGSPYKRRDGIEKISESKDPEKICLIAEALDDEFVIVRIAAVHAAIEMENEGIPLLKYALDDKNNDVALAAIYGLHKVGDVEAAREAAQKHENHFVRREARKILDE